ncbi:Nuclear movement protein nudC [Hondaea fermentalgiana]|uniref:Nuclear movement protein nudC n=1 Tax=Hondaea fermentalgiana TaxID=2315210 RepID=A0A2R5GTI8_9STRA|nr:Nuclear movement protein nudC [Hondaea fermentalgiana]|eukprot:GBG34186.1 Nuclear movement protein nudC [Hondaea fermentalgiana]
MPEDAAMDAAFMSAAQRAGGVEPLLKAFFSFLHRRTDFYCLIPHDMEQAQMGFREGVAKTMDGKQIPLAGNGGVTDRYYWTQNLEELTIYLDIAANVSAKQIECKITQKGLYVARKDTNKVFLEGDFPSPERVRTDECFWSLERNKDATSSTLIISLAKSRETWWDAILQGEPEIDTTQVDSTRRMEEYDEATQATIRKVMFDQRQKSQGLPTSDELAKDQILQDASQLPGSPFSSS